MGKQIPNVSSFQCLHCNASIVIAPEINRQRNHCPYCLWSRHLDLYRAGDRLSACRAGMQPIGLTLKKTWKKYGSEAGELMVIHQCTDCAALSINRLAEDDDVETLLSIYEVSAGTDDLQKMRLASNGIVLLSPGHRSLVIRQLFGRVSLSTRSIMTSDIC